MVILDESGNEITNPNLDIGYLKEEKRFVAHHEATPEVPLIEEIDYEHPVVVYPNGGKIVETVIVQEYQPPQDAWDEYEDIQRYILYTDEELQAKELERKRQEEEVKKAFERENFLIGAPKRLNLIEEAILDHDEFLLFVVEQMNLDEESQPKEVVARTYARLVMAGRKEIKDVPNEFSKSVKEFINEYLEGE